MDLLIYLCSRTKKIEYMSNISKLLLFGMLLSFGALRVMIYRQNVKHIQHYSIEIIVGIVLAIFFTTYCTIKLFKK